MEVFHQVTVWYIVKVLWHGIASQPEYLINFCARCECIHRYVTDSIPFFEIIKKKLLTSKPWGWKLFDFSTVEVQIFSEVEVFR